MRCLTIFTLWAILVAEMIPMAIGEFMLWDATTAMDTVLLASKAVNRLRILALFSLIVNQYVMS